MATRIIIVEDEALIAAEIKSTLSLLGYDIVGHAMNGDKALDLFSSKNMDLVLLDINIKGTLSGIDLARIIRKKYKIPFVYLTSFSDKGTLDLVMETVPYGYIVKPFTESDLKVNIELALHKYQLEHQEIEFTKEYIERKLNFTITDREYEILCAFRDGLTYKETASKLFISVNTVKTYQKRLFQLMEVSSKFAMLDKLRS